MSVHPVMIAAGGTGGHVVPALAVADELRRREIPVIWVGTERGIEARLVPAASYPLHTIQVVGLRGKSILKQLLGPWQLSRAVAQCLTLMKQNKPRAVLGVGGYVTGPVAVAAWLRSCPVVLHEQNAIPGLTNRMLASRAHVVLEAFAGAFGEAIKARLVGNPVRGEIAAVGEQRHIESDVNKPLRLLVIGGSQGARALNEMVPAAVARIEKPVSIMHQCGQHDLDAVHIAYAQIGRSHQVQVTPFIDDMASAWANCDLAICRSGAMTVSELAASATPSLLVPFPQAVDDHQTVNARALVDVGAARLCPQSSLTPETLAEQLKVLASDRAQLELMSVAARSVFRPGAAAAVADALEEVVR